MDRVVIWAAVRYSFGIILTQVAKIEASAAHTCTTQIIQSDYDDIFQISNVGQIGGRGLHNYVVP